MNRHADASPTRHRVKSDARTAGPSQPRSVPIVAIEAGDADEADQPFEEGAHDVIDPDLRHRMISEAAYALYVQRGYVDGFDVDDWMSAEAAVDHVRLDRGGGGAPADDVQRAAQRDEG